MYYWYFGTLAMFQVGGEAWEEWRKALAEAILLQQLKDGDKRGSWSPVGPWGDEGGRVYATALMTMALETPYRYPKLNKGTFGGKRGTKKRRLR